jgi:hypothetical protein
VQSNRPDLVTGHRICEVSYSAPHFGQQNMTVSPTFLSVRPCSTISAAHFLTKVSLGTPEAGGRSATTETRRRVNFRKRPDARRFPDDTRRFPNQTSSCKTSVRPNRNYANFVAENAPLAASSTDGPGGALA